MKVNLRRADLRGADLRGASLQWADLHKAIKKHIEDTRAGKI